MKHYLEPVDAVCRETESSADGLSQEQVQQRLTRDGKNKLAEPKKESLIKRFFSQMMDPMILILLASALVSGITAAYANESFADVFIILFYVMVTYGGYQLCTRAKQAVSTMPQFTMGQVYTIFPIAGVLCILSAVLNLIVELTAKPEGGESK